MGPKKKQNANKVAVVEEADDGVDTPEGREYFQNDGTILVKPHDQLKLTEKELQQELTVILTSVNTKTGNNLFRYNYKEAMFLPIPLQDQLSIHISIKSNLIPEEELKLKGLQPSHSEEADVASASVSKSDAGNQHPEANQSTDGTSVSRVSSASQMNEEQDQEDAEEEEEAADEEKEEVEVTHRTSHHKKEKKATNQFNFTDRASLTYYMRPKLNGSMTSPPPVGTLCSQVNQWRIYDAYRQNWLMQEREKMKDKRGMQANQQLQQQQKRQSLKRPDVAQFGLESQNNVDFLDKVKFSSKIIERMITQNIYDDILMDFKYFEDDSDEFREGKGTLLPLWKFRFKRARKLSVTCISWSPVYHDLFGVGLGSFSFTTQQGGLLLFYSMKNPTYPEFEFFLEAGVMSMEMYDVHPYLVAVGLYDGNVAVFNLREDETKNPVWISSTQDMHHDPVWKVHWLKKNLDDNLCLTSISSDGFVVLWTIINKDMHRQTLITLQILNLAPDIVNGTQLVTLGGGFCFSFHPTKPDIYLVGTIEGEVNVCSQAYRKAFLRRYQAHNQSIYDVAWNPFHDDVFATCGADWSVKIWDLSTPDKDAMFTFDLGGSVGGVAWAPYSSTVFVAATSSGKAYVFDLNVNKYEPLCEQVVASRKKSKLLSVAFNPSHPVINIGDDNGCVTCLKLSPNLRKKQKEKKLIPGIDAPAQTAAEKEAANRLYEFQKLDKILSLVRNQTVS